MIGMGCMLALLNFISEGSRPSGSTRDARIQFVAVGCAILWVPGMGTLLMGFKFPVETPEHEYEETTI